MFFIFKIKKIIIENKNIINNIRNLMYNNVHELSLC